MRTARAPPDRRSVACSSIAYKIEAGNLFIKAGEIPTPGRVAAVAGEKHACA
jgi:hypothetical protein